MNEPLAYLNGEYLPFHQARVSVADYGLVRAATVTEMIRTFRHRPFRLEDHLRRLSESLRLIGLESAEIVSEVCTAVEKIVAAHRKDIAEDDDMAVTCFVTPGVHSRYLPAIHADLAPDRPTVCVHTLPLAFEVWSRGYEKGVQVVTPSIQQLPAECLNPRIKSRSRLHWYLADREVRQSCPHSMALLLDREGYVTETESGNLLVYDGESIVTPHKDRVLDGISQHVVFEIAGRWGIPRVQRSMTPDDVCRANEAFLSSTGYCLLPVTCINGEVVGAGTPGPLFERLLAAWSDDVGVDIIAQAHRQTQSRLP